ncbi:MAG: glycerophosphodiester phosphodiesterase family protein [Bacilli bacterium]
MNKNKVIAKVNPLVLKGIAHRGLHNDEYTENGLKAFQNAIEHNLAFELDVHLTTDDRLIVCHDSSLLRTTGKEGIIEDLSVKEIKDNYRLLDGEEVPTFQEVLNLTEERVPIVVELKVFRKNYKPLAKRVIEELSQIKDKKNIIIISFDPRALVCMKKAGFIRQLLVTTDKEYAWIYHLRFLFESVDLDYRFLDQEKVRKYSKKHFVNIWTIETAEVMEKYFPFCDTMTFQHLDEKEVVGKLSEKNKNHLS